MGIELTEENIVKILMYNDGFTSTTCLVDKHRQIYTTYQILFGKLCKCPGKNFSLRKMEECTDSDEIKRFLVCSQNQLSLPKRDGVVYKDYRADLSKHCKKVAKEFFKNRLIQYNVIGNVVDMTYRSESGKSAWKSEIVFKKDHIVCSSCYDENLTYDFGTKVLEVAGIK